MKTIPEFTKELAVQYGDVFTNERGNTVYQVGMGGYPEELEMENHSIDSGWTRYKTDQDSSIFRRWVNEKERQTLCFCEGDWTLVCCPTEESYISQIKHMNFFYGREN